MRILKCYKNLAVIAATAAIGVILAFAPLAGISRTGTIAVNIDLLPSCGNLIPVSLGSGVGGANGIPACFSNALSSQGLGLLWSGDIPLSIQGSETIANVMLAAGAINMTLLNPGETFSFNSIVGLRTEEKGYQPGLMYSNGEVVTGVGGGICIMSTILYNAALETGLKIIERHPHSGPVSYAEPGRDAAVSFGWADLRFKNDTDSPLLIKAKVENDALMVTIFGNGRPGQTVEITPKDYQVMPYKIEEIEDASMPEGQVIVDQTARAGFAVTIVRTFLQDGRRTKQEIVSEDVMLPQDKKIRVPLRPFAMPADLQPLPAFPENQPVAVDAPVLGAPDGNAQPTSPAPVSGTIKLPDQEPASAKPAQPESAPLSPGSSPAPTAGVDGRNLSTSERATPAASE